MLRLVTYYTPSHEDMCRRFVIQRSSKFHECRYIKVGQTCPTGEFHSEGWNDCMLDKLRTLINLPTDGMPTVYVDADVALFPGLHEWLVEYVEQLGPADVAFSDDVLQWCAGIMVFRCTTQVREFWQTLAHMSELWNLPDQEVIHHMRVQCVDRQGTFPVRPLVLPPERFCNWATVNAPTIRPPWDGEPFDVPSTCLAWHANWTIGIANKLRMLERVVLRETSQPATPKA